MCSMKRTPEWYEAYQRKQATAIGKANAEVAAAWNGNVQPVKLKAAAVYPLVSLCERARIAVPVPEYKFHPSRKWRFDYAWPLHKVAVEQEGGIWTRGRHTRGAGALEDMKKYNAAAVLGWRVLRYSPSDLHTAILDLLEILGGDRAA